MWTEDTSTIVAANKEPNIMQMFQNIMQTLNKFNERLDALATRSTGAIPKRK